MIATLSLGSNLLLCLLISANGNVVERSEDYLSFPENFVLGVATASYQIEGAWNVSDKGESTWDRLTHLRNGQIVNNDNGDDAARSYYRYKEDVATLKKLGFKSYRFSVSWPRILPTGFPNKVSTDGVRYYHNLIDELVANEIEPLMTIYHWDHPQILEEAGGWLNAEMVNWFSDFARIVFKEYASKVKKFIPINEPHSVCNDGYAVGKYMPGKKLNGFGEYLCIHNVLKAHARAYHIYQQEFKQTFNGQVGFLFHSFGYFPKTRDDVRAIELAYQFYGGWTLHPIYSKQGDYPEVMKDMVAAKSRQQGYPRSRLPTFEQEWIDYIRGTADFLAINHYTSKVVEVDRAGIEPSHENDMGVIQTTDSSWKTGASYWLKVVPKGLRQSLRELATRYGNPPIYITENGFSDRGTLNDTDRINYFREYLKEMLLAIYEDGVNVKGYYVWSLLDNFEWHRGYSERFGIVHVDYNNTSRARTMKQSAFWWQTTLSTRRVE